jgi:hypothetical protein
MAPQIHPRGEDTLLGTVCDPPSDGTSGFAMDVIHGMREEMVMKMEIACDGLGWMTDSGSLADEVCVRVPVRAAGLEG